jgi:hypothetical protein
MLSSSAYDLRGVFRADARIGDFIGVFFVGVFFIGVFFVGVFFVGVFFVGVFFVGVFLGLDGVTGALVGSTLIGF